MDHLSMGVSNMKKFLINIAIFFAIVAVVDFSLGKLFLYLQARASGRTGAEYYVCEKATEDVIIMGSSRASHHYVPEIITKKTGMSCFNAGQDGNGIILQYGRWKMLSERYTPKVIIYDVNASFDLETNDNTRYIDRLKPFCDNKAVKDYVSSLYPLERLKLLSNMYRYNYKFIEMAFDNIRVEDFKLLEGYIPLYGKIREEIINKPIIERSRSISYDEVKLYYLERLLIEANDVGSKVILVVSPSWKGGGYEPVIYSEIKDMANRYGVQFVDYLNSDICDIPDCFQDSQHLNDNGASEFIEDLALRIKQ